MQILEGQHHRPLVGEPLEEQPPTGEQVAAISGGPLFEAEQVRQARLHQPPLPLIADMLGDGGAQLRPRGDGVLLLDDAGAGRTISASAQ